MDYCKKYADKSKGEYYFTLRGGSGSAENLFMFLMSYAGVTSFFQEDGTCNLSNPKIAEGLDVYANLYKDGIAVCKAPSFMGAAAFKGTKHPEEATLFVEYLASAVGAGYADITEGRVPVNKGIYEQDWYKENPYYQVYAKFAEQGVKFAEFPFWLDGYNEYAKTTITADFQAVLHGEKQATDVCNSWANDLTKMQQAYLTK